MANWYLYRDGQTHGPYPEEQIRDWLRSGQVSARDKLCREGDQTWSSADMLPEFTGTAGPAPYTVPPTGPTMAPGAKDRTVAGVLAILLGTLGIHHFYLGNTTIGIIYILLGCVGVSPILGVVDGVLYLVKPEDQFQRNYKNWFCSGP
jgi:TM2 domain-containing membrane protein YozV